MPGTIGGYHLLNKIGEGAFGAVYRAYDPSSGLAVAVKILKSGRSIPELALRFWREAMMTSEIDDYHVMRVLDYDIDFDADTVFIVTELMPLSLRDALSAGKLPIIQAAYYFIQMARGLATVDAYNIVHRDIKPENILISEDRVAKISDFGIARAEDHRTLTATGAAIGTDSYMSPEQKRGENVDVRSDIYSLGVTFFEMLTGETPTYGQSLKRIRPAMPDELVRIVNRCLETDLRLRYQSADDLVDDVLSTVDRSLRSRMALIDFYEAANGPNWRRNDNWLTPMPLNKWYGVTTDSDGVVVGLNLENNGLEGKILTYSIIHLDKLTYLDLSSNAISGNIPPEISALEDMECLYLEKTSISGTLPTELGELANLVDLRVHEAKLVGEIPGELLDLKHLETLRLAGNNWTGCIPKSLLDVPENDLDSINLPICDDR